MAELAFNSEMSGMSAALCCPNGDILKSQLLPAARSLNCG